MKGISLFLLTSAALVAGDVPVGFTNAQAARAVIGQATFTAQEPNSSDAVLGAAGGVTYVSATDTLIVADSNRAGATPNNHRVLLFQNFSSTLPGAAADLTFNRKCPVCVGQATVVLGQPDFATTAENAPPTKTSLRSASAVASDGIHLVVADTDHNRVLIWNHMPTTNNAPADVVLGQPDFTSAGVTADGKPSASSMRGPQGVWIYNGRLFVADTQNNRVLIFNQIPTKNAAAADIVLGAPNFTTIPDSTVTIESIKLEDEADSPATASNMLNPVSVTTDGIRLFVSDLGFSRILVWNTIPTSNGAPADFALGQPDLHSARADNAYDIDTDNENRQIPVLCTVQDGIDVNEYPKYKSRCASTLNFPRFALSTGDKLFVADAGSDRILVYNTIPTQNGAPADYILGQADENVYQATDAADAIRTPSSLAWDGANLYVADSYNRRVTVYSIGKNGIPYTGVRNGASLELAATGSITFKGDIQPGEKITLDFDTTTDASYADSNNKTEYVYKVVKGDTLDTIIDALVNLIASANSGQGDPYLYAWADHANDMLRLKARAYAADGNHIAYYGTNGNDVTYSAKVTVAPGFSAAKLSATPAGSSLSGGGDAAKVAAGSIITITGDGLSYGTDAADTSKDTLPTELAGTQVYINGIKSPLLYVSPTQINAQIPWEVYDTTSVSAYVRSTDGSGNVAVTTPVSASIVTADPGIFTYGGNTPERVGVILHGSSYATGIVSVDGSISAGDIATVTIEDRKYTYITSHADTLDTVRDALITLINQDPKVKASAAGVFDRILIESRVEGPGGNGIQYGGTSSGNVIVTAFGSETCCANVKGSPVTAENPAVAGETVIVLATGLGVPENDSSYNSLVQTGVKYPDNGPATRPTKDDSVSSMAGGKTADVIRASLRPGSVGVYEVLLHLNSSLTTDDKAKLTISQGFYTSNTVTFPVNAQ